MIITVGKLREMLSHHDEDQKLFFGIRGEPDSYQLSHIDDCCFMSGPNDIIHDEPYPGDDSTDMVCVLFIK
jgi:hypothetical protein